MLEEWEDNLSESKIPDDVPGDYQNSVPQENDVTIAAAHDSTVSVYQDFGEKHKKTNRQGNVNPM
jgi:hypothetical protein